MKEKAFMFNQARCRELMGREKIDLVLASSRANVSYLSGLSVHQWSWETAIMHFVDKEYEGGDFIPLVGFPVNPKHEAFLTIYFHQIGGVRELTWIKDIKGYSGSAYRSDKPSESINYEPDKPTSSVDSAVEAIRERHLEGGTIGLEMRRIPQSVFAELRDKLPKARFVDAFDLLFKLRSVKEPQEVDSLRKAAGITADVYREVFFKFLKPGATPYELFRRALEVIYERGGFFIFDHNMFETHTAKYNIEPDKKLEQGMVGFVDFGAGYRGYYSDMARVLAIGKASDRMKRVHEVVHGAYLAVRDAVTPGIRACELFRIGAKYMEDRGLSPSLAMMGHGIGRDVHELPFLTPKDETVIEPGMVISIEVFTEVPGLSPVAVEDAGIVTERGWENFTTLPGELREVG